MTSVQASLPSPTTFRLKRSLLSKKRYAIKIAFSRHGRPCRRPCPRSPNAPKYVSRSRLQAWLRSPRRLQVVRDEEYWAAEKDRFFSVSIAKPSIRDVVDGSLTDNWLRDKSLVDCPQACVSLALPKTCAELCKPCCDIGSADLLRQCAEQSPVKLFEADWQNLLTSMRMVQINVTCLQVIDVYVDYKTWRGGHAEVCSKQRLP